MLLRALVVVCPRRRPDELELDPVWVLEEEGVIARPVLGELSGPVRNACPELSETFGGGVEGRVVGDLEAEMVEADAVAIHGQSVFRIGRLAEPDGRAGPVEVMDRLALLAGGRGHAVPAERIEELPIKAQRPLDVGHDEIDMVNTRGTHRATVVRKAPAL
jgi:hypothetical protein